MRGCDIPAGVEESARRIPNRTIGTTLAAPRYVDCLKGINSLQAGLPYRYSKPRSANDITPLPATTK